MPNLQRRICASLPLHGEEKHPSAGYIVERGQRIIGTYCRACAEKYIATAREKYGVRATFEPFDLFDFNAFLRG